MNWNRSLAESIVRRILEATRQAGIPDKRVYVDPLALTLAANASSGRIALDTMVAVRQVFPNVHISIGLSNISYGLPARSYINRAFLILALAAGLDAAIMNPLDRDLRTALFSAQVVLGNDGFCTDYIRAYRAGEFSAPASQVRSPSSAVR